MTPLLEHEGYSRFIDILLLAVEEATATPIYNAGSTTLARSDLWKGFASDSCYYIQRGTAMRGETRVDAQRDPPPDLVVEIDMTHSTLAKLTLYAQFGVAEIWRYDDGRLEILTLEGDGYHPASQSRVVPSGSPLLAGSLSADCSFGRTSPGRTGGFGHPGLADELLLVKSVQPGNQAPCVCIQRKSAAWSVAHSRNVRAGAVVTASSVEVSGSGSFTILAQALRAPSRRAESSTPSGRAANRSGTALRAVPARP